MPSKLGYKEALVLMNESGMSVFNSIIAVPLLWGNWLWPFAVTLVSSIILTAILVKIAGAKGWVVTPRPDRWNTRHVAQFGGLPILLAFSIGSLFLPHARQTFTLLLLTWGMGLLGLIDDIVRLPPRAKLIGQMLLSGLAIYAGIIHPLTFHPWLNALFTLFWIVGITNAINLLDNMDGLAGGISIIALVQIVVLAGSDVPMAAAALCLTGAIAGFLCFNVNPAKIFMGDVGALSIGFFLACASVKTTEHLSNLASVLFVPFLIFFIPIFDTLLVSITRKINGRAISRGARDHTSHRLVMIGLNERQAVALLWIIAVVAGIMAYLWKSSWADLGAGIVALFLIGATLFWIYLAKLQLPHSWLSQDEIGAFLVPKILQQLITRISAIAFDAVLIALALYFALLSRFGRLNGSLFGRFLFAAALSIGIKLVMLLALGVYQGKWNIKKKKDTYPIVFAILSSTFILMLVSFTLPSSKTLGLSVLLVDAVLTSVILMLCRFSSQIFDDLLLLSKNALAADGESTKDEPTHDSSGCAPEVLRQFINRDNNAQQGKSSL